jgi:hypothetical protein
VDPSEGPASAVVEIRRDEPPRAVLAAGLREDPADVEFQYGGGLVRVELSDFQTYRMLILRP